MRGWSFAVGDSISIRQQHQAGENGRPTTCGRTVNGGLFVLPIVVGGLELPGGLEYASLKWALSPTKLGDYDHDNCFLLPCYILAVLYF